MASAKHSRLTRLTRATWTESASSQGIIFHIFLISQQNDKLKIMVPPLILYLNLGIWNRACRTELIQQVLAVFWRPTGLLGSRGSSVGRISCFFDPPFRSAMHHGLPKQRFLKSNTYNHKLYSTQSINQYFMHKINQ